MSGAASAVPMALLPRVSRAAAATGRRCAFPLLLLLFGAIQLAALLYFTSGFFLTRFELPLHQSCAVPLTHEHRAEAARLLQSPTATGAAAVNESVALSPASCWYPRQYDRVVILLIDALRFDFLLHNETAVREAVEAAAAAGADPAAEPSYPPFENGLPIVERLLRSPSSAAHSALYRFEADPPTVTMQRLKGLTTGGLPTFIDIKDNFASSAIAEDNWIWQLVHSQKGAAAQPRHRVRPDADATASPSTPRANRMHFFGDDTWFDLYPPGTHFSAASKAYPSFNVKDLHTVDEGCLENLGPLLAAQHRRIDAQRSAVQGESAVPASDAEPGADADADEWDVTLAHFLGVDHVGHRYGPSHPAMRPKLAQMNGAMEGVVQLIEAQRGLNAEIRGERARRARDSRTPQPSQAQQAQQHPSALPPLPAEEEVLLLVMGDHGMTPGGNHGGQSPEEIYAGLFVYSTRHVAQVGGGKNGEGRVLEELRSSVSASSSSSPSPSAFPLPPLSPLATSYATVPQVDLVPTLSLLLGLPIPFGSVGKVIPELFWGRDDSDDDDDGDSHDSQAGKEAGADVDLDVRVQSLQSRVRGFAPLLRALRLNALQLWQYLVVYSAAQGGGGGFSPGELEALERLFRAGEDAWHSLGLGMDTGMDSGAAASSDLGALQLAEQGSVAAARAYTSFLASSAALARAKWTTFDMGRMAQGLALLALVALVRAGYEANAAATRAVHSGWAARGKVFAHPALALSKLLAMLLLAILAPLHLFSALIPSPTPSPSSSPSSAVAGGGGGGAPEEEEDVPRWVRSNEAFLAGAGACVAALVALGWNLRKKLRLCAPAPSGPDNPSNSSNNGSGFLLALRAAKVALVGATFDQFVAVLVGMLHAQGLFSNSFIINESGVAAYSAAIIAASWLFGSGRAASASIFNHHSPSASSSSSALSSSEGATGPAARRSSWTSVVFVLVLLVATRCMGYAAYSAAPDSGFQDDAKYGPADLVAMLGALVLLPVLAALLARRGLAAVVGRGANGAKPAPGVATPSPRGTGLLALVHYVLYPAACLGIFVFWTLQNAAPAATETAAAATGTDADAAGAEAGPGSASDTPASTSLLSVLLVVASAILRTLLLPLQLSEVQLAWVVRVALPRLVYATSAAGIAALVAFPVRIRTPMAASSKQGASSSSSSSSSHTHSSSGGDSDSSSAPMEESVELATEQPQIAVDGIVRRRKDHPSPAAFVTGQAVYAAETALDAAESARVASARAHLFAVQVLGLCSLLSLPLMLVWGPKSAVIVLALGVVAACMVRLDSASASSPTAQDSQPSLSLSELCFVFFLSVHAFYCTGHALSFSSLQVSCAFIGFDEFSYYVSGALLLLNTFGGVVAGAALALAVVAFRACDGSRAVARHAGLSSSSPTSPTPAFMPLLSGLSYLYLLRSACSVFNVLLQRRHLMVWAIFAPKFIFDAVAGVVADVAVVGLAAACTRWTEG